MAVVEHASSTLRARGDELGLARAAYLMSDLTWLDGRPGRVLRRTPSACSPTRAAPGAAFDVATALIFMAWGLVEGPWPAPEAIARCDALAAEAGRASAPPS